ncbi:MAG: glycoside hydrolase domain-containing protein, partial [Victivallales bacterium]
KEDTVQILWFGVDIPRSATGSYCGQIEFHAGTAVLAQVEIELHIAGAPVDDHGDREAGNLSRLRWLDSTAGSEPGVTSPFSQVQTSGQTIRVLGHALHLGADGLPEQIESFYNSANTRIVAKGQELLARPCAFVVRTKHGKLQWEKRFGRLEKSDMGAYWTAKLTAEDASATVDGRLDYTGSGSLKIIFCAKRKINLSDISLDFFWLEEKAQYFMGLGQEDGRRPSLPVDWKWNPGRHQDSFWMGEVNGGLMLRFKDENYRRPLVNIYYKFSPLLTPQSWDSEGRGGITVGAPADGVVPVRAYSGERTLDAGDTLTFIADFYLTPFHTVDTEKQWSIRFVHPFPSRNQDVLRETIRDMEPLHGPNVLNIHQAHAAAPFINYPYSGRHLPLLCELISGAHAKGTKARVYYTAREITQNMPELFALHSMNGEIIFPGPGKDVRTIIHRDGPHPWLIENLCEDFIPAWTDHLKMPEAEWDLSVITRPDSRWNNFYLEGLRWMTDALDIDGVYLDDTALDGNSLRRARRILDTRPGRLIDFHTWNHFNEWAGYGHNLLIYMELLPYLDRIWIGEGFNCNKVNSDFWLIAMSGLPFGVMGEMLNGANPWRGLVFGQTARLGWSGDPRGIWDVWDKFGIKGTEFLPYFSPECPVRTGRRDVLASAYRREGRCFVALGSWAEEPCDVILEIDWKSFGLDPEKASFYAPPISGMQTESLWKISDAFRIEPGRGFFLVVDEEPRALCVAAGTDEEIELFSDLFSAPTLEAAWSIIKTATESARVGNFAGALQIDSPDNAYAYIERVLPGNVRTVVMKLTMDIETVWKHGPGLSLVWPYGFSAAIVYHSSENIFSLHAGTVQQKIMIDLQGTIEALRIQIDEKHIRFQVLQDSKWHMVGEESRTCLAGDPAFLRIGKMQVDGYCHDTVEKSEGIGRCAINSVKVFGRR